MNSRRLAVAIVAATLLAAPLLAQAPPASTAPGWIEPALNSLLKIEVWVELDADTAWTPADPEWYLLGPEAAAELPIADRPNAEPAEVLRRAHAGGGLLLDHDGLILTGWHLVRHATPRTARLRIVTRAGESFSGDDIERIAADPASDIALLRVPALAMLPLTPIAWGQDETIRLGEEVWSLGHPLDYEWSVTTGILSARNRRVLGDAGPLDGLLQTTAPLNAGSSGGGLYDRNGRVIGMVSAIATTGETWQGLGFAEPAAILRMHIADLMRDGRVRRGYLGTLVAPVPAGRWVGDDPLAIGGARLEALLPDSPAERSGLRAGDVISHANNEQLKDGPALLSYVAKTRPGDIVTLRGQRGDEQLEIEVTLGAWPPDEPNADAVRAWRDASKR